MGNHFLSLYTPRSISTRQSFDFSNCRQIDVAEDGVLQARCSHGPYPIGIDADPDLSPDNQKIVFSRLKTGQENIPFGIYELIVVDVDTKEIETLDSSYANMMPQWKAGGILINRQIGVPNAGEMKAMDLKQGLYVYINGKFEELEAYPFNIFPLGAYGGYWIERE